MTHLYCPFWTCCVVVCCIGTQDRTGGHSSCSADQSCPGESRGRSLTLWRNKHPDSGFWSRAIYHRDGKISSTLLGLIGVFIFTPVYQLDCSSVEVTSVVKSLCFVMLTSDWCWRGNVVYFMNVTPQRGEGQKKRERQSFVVSECWHHLTANGQKSNVIRHLRQINRRVTATTKYDHVQSNPTFFPALWML